MNSIASRIATALLALVVTTALLAADNPRVNVNTATEAELQLLPGVGPKIAAKIRATAQAGQFKSIDELIKVKGIGPKKLEQIRPYVALEGPTTAKAEIRAEKKP